MVNLSFKGRLGNNMFQHAAFWCYCKKNNIKNAYADYAELSSSKYLWTNINKKYRIHPTLFKQHLENVYIEGLNGYEEIPIKDGINLYGYFQSPKYFERYRKDIFEMYTNFIGERVPGRLGIHIRLGDYLTIEKDNVWFTLDKAQIEKALSILNGEYKEIIVFSDSPEKANELLPSNLNIIFDTSGDEKECLQKMTSCEYFIASNSTFSWWACYLGQIPNVVVHYPWLKNFNQDELYLPNWKNI